MRVEPYGRTVGGVGVAPHSGGGYPSESIVRYERRTAWLGGEFPTDGIGFEIGDVTFFVPELVSVYDILPPSPNKDRTEIFMDDPRLDIDNY